MGLFDYVRVECPIEGVDDPATYEWQTKDFDWPYMETYRITAEGRLLHSDYHIEDRSDKTAEPGSFASFAGMLTHVHDEWRDMNYHGDLSFGAWIADDKRSIEATARFTDGQVVRIALVAPPET